MSARTGIQWTDATWNPVVGCTKVSQGCKNCYAKTIHDMRHKAHLAGKSIASQYAHPFETIQLKPERLNAPLSWREPRRVFVNSVSDLFHDDVPDEYIDRVFAVMALADGTRSNGRHHTFQILTKRPARMLAYLSDPDVSHRVAAEVCQRVVGFRPSKGTFDWRPEKVWPLPNVWLGVSVENQAAADERIPLLLQTPAAVRFLSCEPLLEPLEITQYLSPFWLSRKGACAVECEHGYDSCPTCDANGPHVDWVIVGGESGKGARPLDLEWVADLLAQCTFEGVPAFVKQLGDVPMEAEAAWRDRDAFRLLSAKNRDRVPAGFVPLHMGRKGDDMTLWPAELRVRQFPGEVPA